MKKPLYATLMFVLFLILSASVFLNVALAQSESLQLGGGEQQDSGKKTLDLGPAPKKSATGSTATPSAQSGSSPVDAPMDLGDLVRTTQGDWDVACDKAGSPCVMAQIGNDEKGTPILEMVLRVLPDPQEVQGQRVVAVTDIITPLGVVLTSGLTMKIDSQQEQRAPFQICTEQGCLVREPLTSEAVDRFKKGGKALVTVVAANQGPVNATISLKGFTRAFSMLK